MSVTQPFSQRLLAWFDVHGRKHLPWQEDRTAYRVWLSEIMLQQTQVTTVIPYFQRFLQHFPTIRDLAEASDDEVMRLWAGLGYYARARNLHACARQISKQYDGEFPASVDELQQLPGIGRSTAGAIVAQAYGRRAVILDGNVKRVLARYRMIAGWPGKTAVQKVLWSLADELTPADRAADYTQAIMDLGATICRRKRPECGICPVREDCRAAASGVVEQYPERKQRQPLPIRDTCVLLCYERTQTPRLLVEKRPPSGIWGGLWSLPQCDPVQEPADLIASKYRLGVRSIEEGDPVMHTFTHFQLRMRPLWVQLDGISFGVADSSVSWCDADSATSLGMPRPIATLVKDFFVSNR